jgi:hypothetical protein
MTATLFFEYNEDSHCFKEVDVDDTHIEGYDWKPAAKRIKLHLMKLFPTARITTSQDGWFRTKISFTNKEDEAYFLLLSANGIEI